MNENTTFDKKPTFGKHIVGYNPNYKGSDIISPAQLTPEQRQARRLQQKFEYTCKHPKRHKFNKLPIRHKPIKVCLLKIQEPKTLSDTLHNLAYAFQQATFSTHKFNKTLALLNKFLRTGGRGKKNRCRVRAAQRRQLLTRSGI